MSDTSPTPQPRSMRLIFEYDGDDVRLVMQQPVDLPPTATPAAQQTGHFVEMRDAAGRTLTRVAAHGALPESVEVFPEQHDDPITRLPVARPRGAFTIIVPALQDADHVRLVHVTASPGDATQPATHSLVQPQGATQEREIARFPLQIRR